MLKHASIIPINSRNILKHAWSMLNYANNMLIHSNHASNVKNKLATC